MRKLALIFIIAGLVLLGVGGYQYFKIQAAEKQAATEAKEFLKQPSDQKSAEDSWKYSSDTFFPETGLEVGFF